ncbi:GntR family transcriptional regulator [Pseudonocardia benzenivorans]
MPADDLERRIGAHSFARLLGQWRPPDGRALAAALADQVRLLVLDGRLALGTRVPAERELAAALDVSRTTVAHAYESLRENGSCTAVAVPGAGRGSPTPGRASRRRSARSPRSTTTRSTTWPSPRCPRPSTSCGPLRPPPSTTSTST